MITMITITQKTLIINKKHLRARRNNVSKTLQIMSNNNE